MSLTQLHNFVMDKDQFSNIQRYIDFCSMYLEYIRNGNLQATIVSQNENHYQFYQYNQDADFRVTRPINSNLMYDAGSFNDAKSEFIKILGNIRGLGVSDTDEREIINRTVYTLQQSIGAALDSLPAGEANRARKLNGDYFERLILFIISHIGVPCTSETIKIPVEVNGEELFSMKYQHDLIVKEGEVVKVIGSIKTSSKDRIDKIFMDKFLYNRLTGGAVPHIAIFLNDVQRKKGKKENQYGISATFLPGHFKGYTVKLNPLDGVYYCDIRPNMQTEDILKDHIQTFDNLLIDDIWEFM